MPRSGRSRTLLGAPELRRVLRRMAAEIVERAGGTKALMVVGIQRGGVHIARRIQALIAEVEGVEVPLGMVDITLYRDDAFLGLPNPIVGETIIPGNSLAGQNVVLVDDVLFTGRTVRAALDALMDFGRPARIHLAVVVDRGLRELPIQADVVGLAVESYPGERVEVELSEHGLPDRAILYPRPPSDAQE